MKKTNALLLASSVLSLSLIGEAQAGIVWADYYYNYNVVDNSALLHDHANGAPDYEYGPLPTENGIALSYSTGSAKKSKVYYDDEATNPINARVNSTHSATEYSLTATLVAGATGNFIGDKGVSVSGWQSIQTKTDGAVSNGLTGNQSMTADQSLIAFNGRRFTVSDSGTYLLEGLMTGAGIAFTNVGSSLEYTANASVALYVTEEVNGNVQTTELAKIILDLTDPENSGVLEVGLLSGNYIYSVQTNLLLETRVGNESYGPDPDYPQYLLGERLGDIAEGAFVTLGDEFNPVNVEATLAPVPVPSAVVLFFTAMTGLFGVSRRRAK
jgi:hypothetical protein